MSVKKYVIKKNSSNFTTFTNDVLQNLRDYTALGLYCYISSLPHGWQFNKKHLAEHGGIGRDKINSVLRKLEDHNLIKTVQIRTSAGRFAHFEIEVLDGTSFKNNELKKLSTKSEQPLTELPLTANRLLVNSTYKENTYKENKEHKKNIYCASNDARVTKQNRFDEFYKSYPKKRNRLRAYAVWLKLKLDDKADEIIAAVENHKINESTWNDVQFIPYPDKFLANERWKDEIEMRKPVAQTILKLHKPKMNEVHSTVPAWGRGHPSYDSLFPPKNNQSSC